jgi:hypothetical protein
MHISSVFGHRSTVLFNQIWFLTGKEADYQKNFNLFSHSRATYFYRPVSTYLKANSNVIQKNFYHRDGHHQRLPQG